MCEKPFASRVILGDFNFPDVNWELCSGTSASVSFRNAINDSFLTQMVKHPTRGTSILDLVFTDDPSIFCDVSVIEPLLGSDHRAVRCCLAFTISLFAITHQRSFDFKRGDWSLYAKLLKGVPWEDMFASDDPDYMWNYLKHALLNAASAAIPCFQTQRKFLGVYVCGEVKRALNARRKAYKRYRNCSSDFASQMIQSADCRLKLALINSRTRYEHNLVMSLRRSPREFWKHVHNNVKNKPCISAVETAEGRLTVSDQETATQFNNFFASVFVAECDNNFPLLQTKTNSKLDALEVTDDKIKKILISLPNSHSAGPDGIPNALLSNAGHSLIPVLTRFLRSLFVTGTLPSDWRLANVIPIFKKGARTTCTNYRPISLTSTCCKVAERIVKEAVLAHIEKNQLLNNSQHGFLPRRSCLTSLLLFFELLTNNVEQGLDTNVIYIDFAKAFDSVPHGRLLYKLKSFGICGAVLSWIESFITNRMQRVVIRGESSSWANVVSGVPQGSVLGPLLFLLFIDDIDHCFLHSVILKYADDAKVIFPITSGNSMSLLQADLDRLVDWSRRWLLGLNLSKCRILHFGSHNQCHKYYLSNVPLNAASEERDLGVCVTDDLKPSRQCLLAAVSSQRVLNLIRLSFHHLDLCTFSLLYKTMVRTRLEYCIPAWSPCLQKDILVLERVQRRATRILPILRSLSYRDRLRRLQLSSLSTRRLRYDLITVFKMLNGFIDLPFDSFFSLDRFSRTRGHSFKLKVPFAHHSSRYNFFSHRVVNWWNKLPDDCLSATSISLFKSRVDTFLARSGLW
jgi:hypothetical protein